MDLLKNIKKIADSSPERIALNSGDEKMTYGELWEKSEILGNYLLEKLPNNSNPIVVYGHKSPYMIVAFLACVKSGRAYCPVDTSTPQNRLKDILNSIGNPFIITTSDLDIPGFEQIFIDEKSKIFHINTKINNLNDFWLSKNDTYYIIFTSGSTGKPKGIEVSMDNLNNFLDWISDIGSSKEEKQGKIFINQAPFSFDLSVMDIYTSLACGGTLWIIPKSIRNDYSKLMNYLSQSHGNIWVSTPSFVDLALGDKLFNKDLMPNLDIFLFCGEKLSKTTADNLMTRFPQSKIINTYGPTESTVAVTSIEITDNVLSANDNLPIGYVKKDSKIIILKEDGTIAPKGEKGEILISGNTLAKGYFKDIKKTEESFISLSLDKNLRYYKTGDEGYFLNDCLYFCGRLDFQIKMNGYRMELGDIERNLLELDGIEQSCVLPRYVDGKIKSLVAFVVAPLRDNSFKGSQAIRNELKIKLPSYMVPKKITFMNSLPITENGKIDRKKLEELI